MISVRIVTCDYYMSYPVKDLDVIYNEFRGVEVRQVPVIQIYGYTKTGQKSCVNVHGVYPYIYIPYDGLEPAGSLCYRIATELDKAINVSLGQGSSNAVHVHNVILVNGTPLYGYHKKQHQFLKIYFYNPILIQKVRPLLENGGIISKYFQPHEAHLTFILQFMIDYNLHGMSFINLSDVIYRRNLQYLDFLENISPDLILPESVQCRSISKLEMDVKASSIMNKYEVSSDNTVNPGIVALWEDEKQRRRDKNMDSQISHCLTQDRQNVKPTATHMFFANKLSEKLSQSSREEISTDLDKFVYPVEITDSNEYLNASEADNTILETFNLDETIKDSQNITFNDVDENLLKMLQDLKENAAIEDDSILSQKVQQEEADLSDDEDYLSMPFNKNMTDDDSVWENSFWDENIEILSQIPQIDGQYDLDVLNNFYGENKNIRKNLTNSRIKNLYVNSMIQSLEKREYTKNETEMFNVNSETSYNFNEDIIINDVNLGRITPILLENINDVSSDSSHSSIHKQSSFNNNYLDELFCNDLCILNDSDTLETLTSKNIRNDKRNVCCKLRNKENGVTKSQRKLHSNLHNTKFCIKSIEDLTKISRNTSQYNYKVEFSVPDEIFHSLVPEIINIKCKTKNDLIYENNNFIDTSMKLISLDGQVDTDSSQDKIYPKRRKNENKQINKRKERIGLNDRKMKKNNKIKLDSEKMICEEDNTLKENTYEKSKQNKLVNKELRLCLVPLELMFSKDDLFVNLKSPNSYLDRKLINRVLNLNNENIPKYKGKYELKTKSKSNSALKLSTTKESKLEIENSLPKPDKNKKITWSSSSTDDTNVLENLKNKKKRKLRTQSTLSCKKRDKIVQSKAIKMKTFSEINNKGIKNSVQTQFKNSDPLDNKKINKLNKVQRKEQIFKEMKSEKNNIRTENRYNLRTQPSSAITLNKSPVRKCKSLKSPESNSKYSPLTIIKKSPRKQSVTAKAFNSDYEPRTKRLRKTCSSAELSTKIVNNEIPQVIGELQMIQMLQKSDENKKNVINYLSPNDNLNKLRSDNVKRNLFNNMDKSNITILEEFKSCSYENVLIKSHTNCHYENKDDDVVLLRKAIISNLKKDEERFLSEIDAYCNYNNSEKFTCNEQKNVLQNNDINLKKLASNLCFSNSLNNGNISEKIKQSNDKLNVIKPKFVKKKDKRPISPSKMINFDVCNKEYNTPEKNTYDKNFFSPKETLSQQCDKEINNKNDNHTKVYNLTVAEEYDLKRNFAPQPSTSKIDDNIIEYNSENSFFCNEISFIDKTFIMNDSQTCVQNNVESNFKIWMPKYNPPTWEDIENSLREYNIPENRFQKPFYSNYVDITKKVDIGHNVLKIPSISSMDFEEFESSVRFIGIEKWRIEKFKMLYPTEETCKNLRVVLADHSKFIITPVNLPPNRQDVITWLKSKVVEKTPCKKIQKSRIIIPLSPGNSNDSFESVSLSPCTPDNDSKSIKLSQNSVDSLQSSFASSHMSHVLSQDSPSLIRQGKYKKRNNLQRKVLFSQSKKLDDENQIKINLAENMSSNNSCQITGVTLDNTHGFQMSYENLQDAKAISEYQFLTIFVVELHIRTRSIFNPDPQYDAICAIFYSILNDVPSDFNVPREETGIIAVDFLPGSPIKDHRPILEGTGIKCQVQYVKSETELFNEFIKLIRTWDPDIFIGFEIEMLSWGYLIERGMIIGINLLTHLSRINPEVIKNKTLDYKQSDELKLTGRIILDGWRLFRHEIALQSYTFESLMYHILHQRVPTYSFKNLSFWWDYRSNVYRHITTNYYILRVKGILRLIDQLDIIGRTSELARLFGIQFYEVLSRGSQFRVESMMLRLAKPSNYISVSPSTQQRAKMRAPEFVPLIFEPESRFYTDPIIVLDFQSLYPSIIIAYNYCFSTCIGRIDKLGTDLPFEFGASQLKIPKFRIRKLQSKLNFSPCGVGFVTSEVRKGILPRMLQEILETRLMVKKSMKENKDNKLLQRVLHNRQLGLKLIANVTYGYTSANFSGRMPCVEIGDSVVSKGRETLERAIQLIEAKKRWQARVVYGDTDSLFVLVRGKSRQEAFKIGEEIAEAVTNDNPAPVKLKLEKIYQPCILQTKKRYVGYMYESIDQKEPEYNAKGIETVRRDGCPAVAKMLEKSLRILFDTRDVSLIKRYVCRQFDKIFSGRVSIQDLTFAREYRGAQGYRPGACVPALELAKRWTVVDKRKEPRPGQRVPYIIVHGPPGVPLIRLVRCPRELLDPEQQITLRPNAVYYITKVIIPALNRCFSLIGADVHLWYNEMPRKQLQNLPTSIHIGQNKKGTISQYFATMNCVVCNNQTREGLCENCCLKPQQTVVVLQEKLHYWERSCDEIQRICQSCCNRKEQLDCISLDCPVLYRLNQIKKDLKHVPFVRNLFIKF